MDLASTESIAAFGEVLRGEGNPVHLLINNAGVMTPPDRQPDVSAAAAVPPT
ncbi:hypothetical protein [Actinotalea sp. K2]|uniref:hypothetical protein n=1 Tax=Actinotalea sp. K2 TaxID=2939438 RepID=UPI002017B502|nr:hypothetical protein [Actinotalea sp. K2]MCL3859802.1 hypothetical protein [Actinotalea sp. K2]